MTRRLLIGLMAALCAAAVPTGAQGMTPPDALAKSVTEDVLTVLRTDRDIRSGNTKKVIDLVEKKVLPHFNFVRMTQLAVGRHWRDASPEQRKQLVEEFRTLLVQTYAATLTAYREQSIEIRPLRMQPDETDVVVRSLINQSGGKPVTVDYKMQKSDTGWKVYDVVVADLSLVQSYRGSFNTEVQKGGIDGLVKTLTEKNKQLVSRQ